MKTIRKQTEVYSSKSVFLMVGMLMAFFSLLYSIGSFLHESQKIQEEIEKIQKTNESLKKSIEEKKRYLQYLQTPQRIEKEVKMQMGKALPGEKVIVFVEESLPLLPTEKKRKQMKQIKKWPPWKKWQWVFFRKSTPPPQ